MLPIGVFTQSGNVRPDLKQRREQKDQSPDAILFMLNIFLLYKKKRKEAKICYVCVFMSCSQLKEIKEVIKNNVLLSTIKSVGSSALAHLNKVLKPGGL